MWFGSFSLVGLCTSKENGGLGFSPLKPFQEALMGKQLAKLYDKSPSLWARVIKHKYNPPARIWELQAWQHVSQAWRAVVEGRDILQWGLKWEIGDGASVKFFKDVWVSSSPPNLWPNLLILNDTDKNVKEFISPTRQWDQRRFIETVGIVAAQVITRLPLPHGQAHDRMRFLGPDLIGYSINKAYKLLTSTGTSQDSFDWKWVWGLPCSQRIRTRCRKVFKGCVPMRAFLYSKAWWVQCDANVVTMKQRTFIIPFCCVLGPLLYGKRLNKIVVNNRALFNPTRGMMDWEGWSVLLIAMINKSFILYCTHLGRFGSKWTNGFFEASSDQFMLFVNKLESR